MGTIELIIGLAMDETAASLAKRNTRLRRLRNAMNLTQADLAQRTGTTRQKVIALEDGDLPSLLLGLRLARFFGTTVEVLFAEAAREAKAKQPEVRRRRARIMRELGVDPDEVPVFLPGEREGT